VYEKIGQLQHDPSDDLQAFDDDDDFDAHNTAGGDMLVDMMELYGCSGLRHLFEPREWKE
jgi:hypothetical protein